MPVGSSTFRYVVVAAVLLTAAPFALAEETTGSVNPRSMKDVHDSCVDFLEGRPIEPAMWPVLVKRCMKGVLCRMKADARMREYAISLQERQDAIDVCVAGEQA